MAEIVVYYIAKKKTYKDIPAFIEVIFNFQDGTMSVINLQSTNPGKEYATHLFLHACQEAKKRGISIITLDDCSDRYRKHHNIYTKLGMTYDDKIGGPEMSGKVDDISKYKTITDAPVIYSITNIRLQNV